MIFSKFCMSKELEQLQINDCMTDVCLVGASHKVFIHRAMVLLAAHILPDPVWYDPDPGEMDGKAVVIIPDASTAELESFVRKLYCPEDDLYYTAVPNTPDKVPGTPPDIFHTAVPQTPLLQPPEEQDSSVSNKRHLQQQLDMVNVSLRLLNIQREEALARSDKDAVINLMSSIDVTNEEKVRLETELEDCDTSAESFEVKEEDAEVKVEVKEEESEAVDPICSQCGAEFKSDVALCRHKVEVHQKLLKVCDICGKSCDSQKALTNHKRMHKKVECDICHKVFAMNSITKHKSTCIRKPDDEPPEEFQCLVCKFSTDSQSCLSRHIRKEHHMPVTLQCPKCDYSTKSKRHLNRHINFVHLLVKEKCDSCSKEFNSREVLERHKRNAHQVKSGAGPILFHNLEAPKADTWYPCNQCDYKSRRKIDTERHKKKHLRPILLSKQRFECCHCGKNFSRDAKLKHHLDKCKQFVSKKIGEEEAVELLCSGLNKTKVNSVLKIVRKVSGRNKVQTNLMKTVNTSVKNLEKWFTSKQIKLKRNPESKKGKKKVSEHYVTSVAYCTNKAGFMRYIKKNRKIKNAQYLISADGGMYHEI